MSTSDDELFKDLTRTQIAFQPILSGSTETASDRTSNLSTQAKGQSFFAGDYNHFNTFAVV